MIEVLEEIVDLCLALSLESGEVVVLFDPEVAMEGQFVLEFEVFGVGFEGLELGGEECTFWRKF